MNMPNLCEIAALWLREYGYHGLSNHELSCACLIDDLMPCGEPSDRCEAGWKHPCDCENECGFHIMGEPNIPSKEVKND
jgi:hypothetical protein